MQTTQTPAPAPADPGFKLPGADAAASAPPAQAPDPLPKTVPESASTPIEVAPVAGAPVTDTSTRDLAIGSGIFVVLLIVYFFVRNAYVHHLVVKRVAPSSAGSAGWLLFLGLGFISAAAVLAIINASKFLTVAVTAPLVVVGLVALIAAVFTGRR